MSNFASKLRLPQMKDTQWQILAGPVLIMLILAMMVLPLPAFYWICCSPLISCCR